MALRQRRVGKMTKIEQAGLRGARIRTPKTEADCIDFTLDGRSKSDMLLSSLLVNGGAMNESLIMASSFCVKPRHGHTHT